MICSSCGHAIRRKLRLLILLVSLATFCRATGAPPTNDNCTKPNAITITNGGFGLGAFTSSQDDISGATIQAGETFAPAIFAAGLDQKSLWYKFTLPTKRLVKVTLLQNGSSIPAGDAGFTVYKSNTCLPSAVFDKFTPIAKFGTSAFPCVDSGVYLIQVSSKASAKGKVYIQLYLSDSTGGTVDKYVLSTYDKPSNAYAFGKLATNTSHVDFNVDCQTIDDAAEVCSTLPDYKSYTKSTWHTFTTPAFFDYLSVLLGATDASGNCSSGLTTAVGYRLYKGDVKKNGVASLTAIGNCSSFPVNTTSYADYKMYRCGDLAVNTTYTIQLFYKYDFESGIRLALTFDGTKATRAPEPLLAKIPASNQLGVLKEGVTTSTDYFSCNSQHSLHPCGFALPANGVVQDGIRYNLSTFYTFKLSSSANVYFNASVYSANFYNLVRLFKRAPDNTCTALNATNLVFQESNSISASTPQKCLTAGTYTLQIMGSDSLMTSYAYCGYLASTSPLYLLSHLARPIDLSITVDYVASNNLFSLNKKGAFDGINLKAGKLGPLQNTTTYTGAVDTFGCSNGVLPTAQNGTYCNSAGYLPDKAIYREFVIGDATGDNKADSGVITLSSLYGYGGGGYMNHLLFKGDADALAMAQNKHGEGDTIKGLIPYSDCYTSYVCGGNRTCVIPGTYTLVTLGNDGHVGAAPYQPTIQFNVVNTRHYSAATTQNMGSILDSVGSTGSVKSDFDYFSCKDNVVPIDGFTPAISGTDTFTKAIYRQFYLSKTSIVNICENYYSDCNQYLSGSNLVLFSGKATSGLNTLKKMDWAFCQAQACNPMSPGWYTVVAYAAGPSYKNRFQSNPNSYGNAIGKYNNFSISVTPGCPGPKYNRPAKACVDSLTRQPFLLEWKNRLTSTAAYPVTDTTYTLYTEHFNCTIDTPFASFIKPCSDRVNRIVYYVFRITKESYVQINTLNLWGEVFNKDIRKDSLQFAGLTPIQPCLQSNSQIILCRLQPGTYTLVLFAGNDNVSNGCGEVTPTIYIDRTGYSRFDFASKAYDFGVIPSDSAYHNGKTGDKNPLDATRAPSNDFFYCTTGSGINDPAESQSCYTEYDSLIYRKDIDNHAYEGAVGYYTNPRRNLWYSFVVDKPGYVHVKVNNKSPDKTSQYPFAVYRSKVDGNLPFTQVASQGLIDSTITQGLNFVVHNHTYYCYNVNEVNFYIEPCSFTTPIRYYVLVENPFDMQPASQAEVEVMLDSTSAIKPKFDHYYQADDIGTSLKAGTYRGHADNFMCATTDDSDPNFYPCHPKTLWYKFTVGVTGYIRFRMHTPTGTDYSYDQVQLLRELVKGDSTQNGFSFVYPDSYYDSETATYWATECVSPGTYYLMLTGCNKPQGDVEVYPEISISENAGDFCSSPAVLKLTGPSAKVGSLVVDCHTIGTDYGEFAPTLSCPAGAKTSDYKSSWFRIDITGKDTLDVTTFIDEQTNASSSEIKYRLMTGDCGAMQEQSCVEDALTQNTYRCLAPGSYFIQVFTPVRVSQTNQLVKGDIDLHVVAVKHADTCKPDKNCLATARFTSAFDCKTDSSVQFTNYSTYGSSISYLWSLGYGNKTSAEVSPAFFYPALTRDVTYTVKLVTTNTACGKKDSSTLQVKVPARPHVNMGPDRSICETDSTTTLDATSFPGATYTWSTGASTATYEVPYKNYNQFYVRVDYKNCVSTDTINVFINPYQQPARQSLFICQDSIQLSAINDGAFKFAWNTGETNYSIFAKTSGTYWVDMTQHNCTLRDTFDVSAVQALHPLGNDTTVCFVGSYTLDATVPGASSYAWQNGTGGPQFNATDTGTYWVDIAIGNCTVRDSIHLSRKELAKPSISGKAAFCAGDSTQLDAGDGYDSYLWSSGETTRTIQATTGGTYTVTITSNGCTAVSNDFPVNATPPPAVSITGNAPACAGDSVLLDAGPGFATYLWSNGSTKQTTYGKTPGTISVAVTNNTGCAGKDSTLVNISPQATKVSLEASLCNGSQYILPSGRKVSTAGIYLDTVRNSNGCDSLVSTVKVLVNQPVRSSFDTTLCAGGIYITPAGDEIKKAGTYVDTVRSSSGCDSLISTITVNYYCCKKQR